MISILACPAGI